MNEVEVQLGCKNEHIVELYDVFEDEEGIYLVMEYCRGGNLKSYLNGKAVLGARTKRATLCARSSKAFSTCMLAVSFTGT